MLTDGGGMALDGRIRVMFPLYAAHVVLVTSADVDAMVVTGSPGTVIRSPAFWVTFTVCRVTGMVGGGVLGENDGASGLNRGSETAGLA